MTWRQAHWTSPSSGLVHNLSLVHITSTDMSTTLEVTDAEWKLTQSTLSLFEAWLLLHNSSTITITHYHPPTFTSFSLIIINSPFEAGHHPERAANYSSLLPNAGRANQLNLTELGFLFIMMPSSTIGSRSDSQFRCARRAIAVALDISRKKRD